MGSLSDFVRLIQDEAEEISRKHEDSRTPLPVIFSQAIEKTMAEIKQGANSEDFPDFVVINLIIAAAHEDFTAGEIKAFVDELSKKESLEGHQEELQSLSARLAPGEGQAQES